MKKIKNHKLYRCLINETFIYDNFITNANSNVISKCFNVRKLFKYTYDTRSKKAQEAIVIEFSDKSFYWMPYMDYIYYYGK